VSALVNDPSAVSWSLPQLSPEIERLRGLFDEERLAEALDYVAEDLRRGSAATLGQAFRSRVLAAIHEQDPDTLRRVLAYTEPHNMDISVGDLRAMSEARAGALGIELAGQIAPLQSQQFFIHPTKNPTLVAAGLAAQCAAHGYDPETISTITLESPMDIPGALFLPALSIQVLFAYMDGHGLGPMIDALVATPAGPAAPAAATASAALVGSPVHA